MGKPLWLTTIDCPFVVLGTPMSDFNLLNNSRVGAFFIKSFQGSGRFLLKALQRAEWMTIG